SSCRLRSRSSASNSGPAGGCRGGMASHLEACTGVERQRVGHTPVELARFIGIRRRRDDTQRYVLVARDLTRQAASGQTQPAPCLRVRRDAELYCTAEGGYFYLGA